MNTRETSPFPVNDCANDHCDSGVPESTFSEVCTTCENYRQLFGELPNPETERQVELKKVTSYPNKWVIVYYKNREKEKESDPFFSKELAEMRYRERKSAIRSTE